MKYFATLTSKKKVFKGFLIYFRSTEVSFVYKGNIG